MTRYIPVGPNNQTGPIFDYATQAALWIVGREDSHLWTWRAIYK